MSDQALKRLMCLGCGFSYDEALGLPEHGLAPGTRWADIPADWVCPDCGTPKHMFEMVGIGYAPGGPDLASAAGPHFHSGAIVMMNSFIIRNADRGQDTIKSDGSRRSYIAGHPDGFVTRASS